MISRKKKLIFISHSAKDIKIASCFQSFFCDTYGDAVEVFVSSTDGIACGNTPQKEIESKLFASDVIVVLLTEEGRRNDWVTFETGFVAGHKGKVIPLLFDGTTDDVQKPVQMFFQIKKALDAKALEGAIAEIDKVVNKQRQLQASELLGRLQEIKTQTDQTQEIKTTPFIFPPIPFKRRRKRDCDGI